MKSTELLLKEEIPTHLIAIQIHLSQIIENIFGIGAGLFTLHDVISNNRKVHLESLTDFFMIMEVYGHDTELSFDQDSL